MDKIWPILLIVFSSVCYQVLAKLLPESIHPLAALAISYLVSAVLCVALYFVISPNKDLIMEYRTLNIIPFLIGVALVGLEVGTIYMYKVGWAVNTGYMLHSVLIAIALIAAGYLFFKEPITGTKVLGTAICLIGLFFINK